jgi:hypothetical protein
MMAVHMVSVPFEFGTGIGSRTLRAWFWRPFHARALTDVWMTFPSPISSRDEVTSRRDAMGLCVCLAALWSVGRAAPCSRVVYLSAMLPVNSSQILQRELFDPLSN